GGVRFGQAVAEAAHRRVVQSTPMIGDNGIREPLRFEQLLELGKAARFSPLVASQPHAIHHGRVHATVDYVIERLFDVVGGGESREELRWLLPQFLAAALGEKM